MMSVYDVWITEKKLVCVEAENEEAALDAAAEQAANVQPRVRSYDKITERKDDKRAVD